MVQRIEPVVGDWYAHRDKGQLFQVVAFDDEDGLVELQDFDGGVDEVDLDTWHAMPLERAEPPEDWTGSVDDLEPDDTDSAPNSGTGRDWRGPADRLPSMDDLAAGDSDADEES